MELVFAKNKPISPDNIFADCFIDFMGDADYLQLATGYISEDSLLFLKENLGVLKNLHCDLLIGMHVYDGFTQSQYNISIELGEYLTNEKRGSVIVCKAFPYHGKFYNFFNNETHFVSLTGSANLTQIIPTRQRNLIIKIAESESLSKLSSYFDYHRNFCIPIQEYKPTGFRESGGLLKKCIGVRKLSPDEVIAIYKTRKKLSFTLPLKAEEKSNLNIYFGKGRQNTIKGVVKPRSWFEFEVIVSKNITYKSGYPRNKCFQVLTDDGWMFECKTQGDYSKNFRSTGGLATLGMWIKGKMLDAGIVKAGEFITYDMLEEFGSDHIVLTATNDPQIWLLEF